ncbi:MAG: 1-(5-phosphoribosyl)-5-((5-phosphoribosylamino)methylideneamino)imidazole-4-carboxamide isomerase, partial [Polynucleobacter victoriensis]
LTNMKDVDALCAAESEGVVGVIAGRAIYTGDLDLAKAQKHADEYVAK